MNPPPVIGVRSRRSGWWIGIGAAALASGAVLFFFDPRAYGFYPRCIFHSTTGLYCPGCGALRGLHQFLHGHWLAALRFNPLMFAAVPVLSALCLWQRVRPGPEPAVSQVFSKPPWTWSLLMVVVLFWILRNIPVYPLTLLAPLALN